jgi:hypothetical protein
MRDSWIVYAAIGVLVCLLLWRVATQWKVRSAEAENLRASLIILGVVALVLIGWQCSDSRGGRANQTVPFRAGI